MIKILIVDDSLTETTLLKNIINSESDLCVVGTAKNGNEALRLLPVLKPDLITMDIFMPEMNGFEATRLIMSQYPTPIVVISSKTNDGKLNVTFQALEAGALSVLDKANLIEPHYKKVLDTIRSMAEIKVIRRRFHVPKHSVEKIADIKIPVDTEILALGASVGGPQALKAILSKLPVTFPVPIVIVQHITQGFVTGFASYLNDNVALLVKCVEDHEPLMPGTIYFAPDNFHFTVERIQGKLHGILQKGLPVSGFYPSITVLFESIAKTCRGKAIAGLLTGMGNDGAKGLLDIKNAGSHTFIQDAESAVVFGMAGVAESMGAVDKKIDLDMIAEHLIKMTTKKV